MASRNLEIIVNAKDEASKKIGGISDNIEAGMKKASKAALVAGAAMAAFAGKAVNDLANLGEELDLFRQKTNFSTEAASALKAQMGTMGLEMGALEGGVKKMQDNLNTFANNAKTAEQNLGGLGLAMEDLKGLNPEEQFFKLGNAIAQIQDPSARTAAALNIFGKAGTDLIPVFGDGTLTLDQFVAKAKEMGVVIGEDALGSALAFDDAMDTLGLTMEGLKIQIGTALAEPLTDLVTNRLQPTIAALTQWITANPELTLKIIEWTAAILAVLIILPKLVAGIQAVGAVMAFVAANPIVLIIAAIAALVASIGVLIANWDLVKVKVGEVWDWITSKVQGAIDNIKGYITEFMSYISKAIDKVLEFTGIAGLGRTAAKAGESFGKAVGIHSSVRRASGGRTAGDMIVGEEGPERIQLDQHGMVFPNSRSGLGGITLNVMVSGNTLLADDDTIAVTLGDQIINALRLQTKIV